MGTIEAIANVTRAIVAGTVPAKQSGDYEASIIKDVIGEGVIEQRPFKLALDGGYYSNDEGAQGVGGSFEINKSYFWGQGDAYGFKLNPGILANAEYDIASKQLDRAKIGTKPVAPYGARIVAKDEYGAPPWMTIDFSVLPMGFAYEKDSIHDVEQINYAVSLGNFDFHIAFSVFNVPMDFFVSFEVLEFMFGSNKICEKESGYAMNAGNANMGLGVSLGKDVGILRNSGSVRYDMLLNSLDDKTYADKLVVSDRLSFDDIGGVGVNMFGAYTYAVSSSGVGEKSEKKHVVQSILTGIGYSY